MPSRTPGSSGRRNVQATQTLSPWAGGQIHWTSTRNSVFPVSGKEGQRYQPRSRAGLGEGAGWENVLGLREPSW